jgi:hypothetical protein
MAGKPQERPMPVNSDAVSAHLGDPNCIEEMSLQPSGGSVTVAIPAAAVKFLGYEVGETRAVEVYDDGVFIPAEVPDE